MLINKPQQRSIAVFLLIVLMINFQKYENNMLKLALVKK